MHICWGDYKDCMAMLCKDVVEGCSLTSALQAAMDGASHGVLKFCQERHQFEVHPQGRICRQPGHVTLIIPVCPFLCGVKPGLPKAYICMFEVLQSSFV